MALPPPRFLSIPDGSPRARHTARAPGTRARTLARVLILMGLLLGLAPAPVWAQPAVQLSQQGGGSCLGQPTILTLVGVPAGAANVQLTLGTWANPTTLQGPGPYQITGTQTGTFEAILTYDEQTGGPQVITGLGPIRIAPAGQTLRAIEGPAIACRGALVTYRASPELIGVTRYTWTLPPGSTINGPDSLSTIEVLIGAQAGTITARAQTGCGPTPEVQKQVSFGAASERRVLLISGQVPVGAADLEIQQYLISQGYQVQPVIDSAADRARASCGGVVYISASITPARLPADLRLAPQPIIVARPESQAALGLTEGETPGQDFGREPERNVRVVNNTHELGQGVGLGLRPVYQTPSEVLWGRPRANAIVVAQAPSEAGRAAVYGYERGARLRVGHAPARRVGLFIDELPGRTLGAFGFRLLDRAACWALAQCASTLTLTTQSPLDRAYCPGDSIVVPFASAGPFSVGTIPGSCPMPLVVDEPTPVPAGWTPVNDPTATGGEGLRSNAGNRSPIVWAAPADQAGRYQVEVHLPPASGLSGQARYHLITRGPAQTFLLDQRGGTGGYVILGQVDLIGDGHDSLLLEGVGLDGLPVWADGVRWICLTPDALDANRFEAQLSDALGGFSTPTVIGIETNPTERRIRARIPDGLPPAAGYRVRVVATNPSVTGSVAPLSIRVGISPQGPSLLRGPLQVCQGAVVVYTLDTLESGEQFSWTLDGGARIVGSVPGSGLGTFLAGGRVTIAFDSASLVQIRVVSVSRCRQGSPTPLIITIDATNPLPPWPNLVSVLGDTLCPRAGLPLRVDGDRPPNGFRWQSSEPGVLSTDTGRAIRLNLTGVGQGGRLTVTVRGVNACGPGPADSLFIVVDSVGARPRISGLSAQGAGLCVGQQVLLAEVRGADRITWLLPDGLSGAGSGPQLRVTARETGLYRVRAVAEGPCGRSDTASLEISAQAAPRKAYLVTPEVGRLRPADAWLVSRLRRQGLEVEAVPPNLPNLIDSVGCGQLVVVSPYVTGQSPRQLDTLSVPLLAFGGAAGINFSALGWAGPTLIGQQTGTEITLTAVAHPITAGLGVGNRAVYGPPGSNLSWANLPPQANWVRLALIPAAPGRVTLFAREGSLINATRQVGFYADTAGVRRQTGFSQRLLARSICYLTGLCPPEDPEAVTLAVAADTLSFCAGQSTQLLVRLTGFFDSRNQVQVRLSARGQSVLPTTPLLTQLSTDTGGPIPITLSDTLSPGLYEVSISTTAPVTPPARVWIRIFRLTVPTVRVETVCVGAPVTLTLGAGGTLEEGIRYQITLAGRGIVGDTVAGANAPTITLTLPPGLARPPRDTARLTISGLGCPSQTFPAPLIIRQVAPARPSTLADSLIVCRAGGGQLVLSPPLTGVRRLSLTRLDGGTPETLADSTLGPLDTVRILRISPIAGNGTTIRAMLTASGPCGPATGDTITLIIRTAFSGVSWLEGRVCQNGPAQVRLGGLTPGARVRLLVGGVARDSLTVGLGDTTTLSAGQGAQVGQTLEIVGQVPGCPAERSRAPFVLADRRTLMLPDLQLANTICPVANLTINLRGQAPGDLLRLWQTAGRTLGQGRARADSTLTLPIETGFVRGEGTGLRLTLTDGLCRRDSLSGPLSSRIIPPIDTTAILSSDTACPGATTAQLTLSRSEAGVIYRLRIGTIYFDSLQGTGRPITFTVRAFPATPLPDADSTNLRIEAERSPCPPVILPLRAAIVKLPPADTLAPVVSSPVCQGQQAVIRIARSTVGYRYQPFVEGRPIGPERSTAGGVLDIPISYSPNRPDSILVEIRLRGGQCVGLALRQRVRVRWRPTTLQRVPILGPNEVCINTRGTYTARLFPGASLLNPEWRWPESARPDGLAQGVTQLRLRLTAYPGPADTLYLTGEDGCAPIRGKLALRRAPDCLDLIIPNVLTPGQSGPESVWDIQGLEAYPEFRMTVLDQWGGVVHRQQGAYSPWRGQGRGGQPLPVATYYYVIELGRGLPARTGSITVLR